ncbi:uncharacterized protein [Diabrotica undecimpunctata]|uniref:uncharacterized protein n=1 Tax=Diabrotica undecimpunctata TaxID=50387 RepID=UPI003B63CC58
MVSLNKDKGEIQDSKNCTGIKLMSHTMKTWERTIEQSLRRETSIGDEQFGFMPDRKTTDVLFAFRQLIEKYGETKRELHLIFIDFDTVLIHIVLRQELLRCMREKCVVEKYVMFVKDMFKVAFSEVAVPYSSSPLISVHRIFFT